MVASRWAPVLRSRGVTPAALFRLSLLEQHGVRHLDWSFRLLSGMSQLGVHA